MARAIHDSDGWKDHKWRDCNEGHRDRYFELAARYSKAYEDTLQVLAKEANADQLDSD